nr:hypothetical protein [Eggerthella lenta]
MYPFALLGSIPHADNRAHGSSGVVQLSQGRIHVHHKFAFGSIFYFARSEEEAYFVPLQFFPERNEIFHIS